LHNVEDIMESLIQFSEEKYNVVEKIYKLTREQTDAIENEDIDKLNELIEKKQFEIKAIQSLDEKYEKILNELKLLYNLTNLDELDVCADEVKRINYIKSMITNKAKQIQDIEINNNSNLRKSKNQLEEKIRNLKVGKKAVSGYGYNVQNPVYFDKNK